MHGSMINEVGFLFAKKCMKTKVYQNKSVWKQKCMKTKVNENKSEWKQKCMKTKVYENKSVWKQKCMKTLHKVSWYLNSFLGFLIHWYVYEISVR